VDLTGKRSRVTFSDTKSGKGRGVPLPQDVAAMLKKIRPASPKPGDRVFLYRRDDGELLPFDNPKTAWRAARARAGLTWVRIHDLRHYYASRLVRVGVSLYSVQRLLGHSTPSLTQRYAALRPEDLDGSIAALD
jgi:integrase